MKKKNGFFDITEETLDFSKEVVEDLPAQPEINSDGAVLHNSSKKQILVIAIVSVSLLLVFFLIRQLYHFGLASDSVYYPESWLTPSETPNTRPPIEFCEPDWNSDILNDEEYLALKGDILYSPNGSETYSVPEGEYYNKGGAGLQFMVDYVNAVINGDNEKLNAMFTDKYFEDNEVYSDFPQQRLYNIKIRKYHYKDPAYEDSYIVDEYYIITYKIDKNDGLFRDDIGQEGELAQLFELLIYPEGTVKIDGVISIPGYFN